MAATDVIYRRGRDGVWHYCQNCGGWPAAEYEESVSPPSGDTCPECYVLDRAGGCTYSAEPVAEPAAAADRGRSSDFQGHSSPRGPGC